MINLTISEKRRIVDLHEERRNLLVLRDKEKLPSSFSAFCKAAWHVVEPGKALQWGWHMDVVCAHMQAVYQGSIRRIIINIPPRSSKSTIVSVLFNAWVWINDPGKQFLTVSHEESLSIRDAQKTRVLLRSPWFQERWGDKVVLSGDQNEKKFYQTDMNGHRNAVGINAGVTGKGGDIILVDDPHSVRSAASAAERKTTLDSYDLSISTRLNSPADGAIVIIMQRLDGEDLVGHLLKGEEKWTQVIIPMRYEGKRYTSPLGPEYDDPRKEDGELLMPSRFPEDSVKALESRLGPYGASGQLQQRPSPKGGGILRKSWWKIWDKKDPPICDHVFLSWDTAYTEEAQKHGAHSACLGFGIFWDEKYNNGRGAYALMLTCAWDGKVDYVDLREKVKEIDKAQAPDRHLIEKKASGISIIQELKRTGLKIYPYQPDRDKIARAYSVQPLLHAGLVYRPNKQWAEKVASVVSAFPKGSAPSADYTDCLTQALIYLQKSSWVHVDPEEEDDFIDAPTQRRFYG